MNEKTIKKQKFLLQRVAEILERSEFKFAYMDCNGEEVSIVIPLSQDDSYRGYCIEITTEWSERGRFHLVKGKIANDNWCFHTQRFYHLRENGKIKEFKFKEAIQYVEDYLNELVPHENQLLLPEEERDWK